jgi:hypothetical protein
MKAVGELHQHPIPRTRSPSLDLADLALVHANAHGELLLTELELPTAAEHLCRESKVMADGIRRDLRLRASGAGFLCDLSHETIE